jgi:hypothetical protein
MYNKEFLSVYYILFSIADYLIIKLSLSNIYALLYESLLFVLGYFFIKKGFNPSKLSVYNLSIKYWGKRLSRVCFNLSYLSILSLIVSKF